MGTTIFRVVPSFTVERMITRSSFFSRAATSRLMFSTMSRRARPSVPSGVPTVTMNTLPL